MNVYFNQAQKRSGPAVQIKFQETLFPLVASALEKVYSNVPFVLNVTLFQQILFLAVPSWRPTKTTTLVHVPSGSWDRYTAVSHTF